MRRHVSDRTTEEMKSFTEQCKQSDPKKDRQEDDQRKAQARMSEHLPKVSDKHPPAKPPKNMRFTLQRQCSRDFFRWRLRGTRQRQQNVSHHARRSLVVGGCTTFGAINSCAASPSSLRSAVRFK